MDLIEHEAEMIHQIKALDTEMQTLVYDNYNKFITATDTIRRMKSDFIEMEQEMSRLNEKIEQICTQSGDINENLEPGRKEIRKFTSTLDVMKRFKFLFELPAKLREFIDKGEYRNAAVSYTKAFQTLRRYSDNPSFKNIFSECQALTDDLREKLYEIFRSPTASTKQLAECLELFSMLEEPSENLYTEFLSNSELRLKSDLELLEAQLVLFNKSSPESGRQDLLEFIDTGTNGFLSNLCLIIASYNDMFLSNPRSDQHHAIDIEVARLKVTDFAQELMARYFECISKRISYEDSESSETGEAVWISSKRKLYRLLRNPRSRHGPFLSPATGDEEAYQRRRFFQIRAKSCENRRIESLRDFSEQNVSQIRRVLAKLPRNRCRLGQSTHASRKHNGVDYRGSENGVVDNRTV